MLKNISVNSFELVSFYTDAKVPVHVDNIIYVDMLTHARKYPHIIDMFNEFYDTLIATAMEYVENINDSLVFGFNRSAYKIKDKNSGNIYYIGRYDNMCTVSTSVKKFSGKEFNFNTKKWKKYGKS